MKITNYKEPQIGINIIPETLKKNKYWEEISFNTKIGVREKGRWFATSPAVIKLIVEHPEMMHRYLGIIDIAIYKKRKKMISVGYYPIQGYIELFTGKGIASLLELQVLNSLVKKYPYYKIRSTDEPFPDRTRQLTKRGEYYWEFITIKEKIQSIRRYLAQETLVAKKMKTVTIPDTKVYAGEQKKIYLKSIYDYERTCATTDAKEKLNKIKQLQEINRTQEAIEKNKILAQQINLIRQQNPNIKRNELIKRLNLRKPK